MDFSSLNIKLVQTGDYYDVIVYADNSLAEEFGLDFFGTSKHKKFEHIQQYIKNTYPNLNLRIGKILLGGVLVGTFSLGTAATGFSAPLEPYSTPIKAEASLPLKSLYTVEANDTLWKLSNKYGVTVEAIMEENSLTSEELIIGQTLVVPGVENIDSLGSAANESQYDRTFNYTVIPGDTLWIIANKNSTTVDNLIQLNGLTTDYLDVGQQIIVPVNDDFQPNSENDNNGTYSYNVMPGDTLWIIANKHSTNVDKLIQLNGLTTDYLNVGQQILVPTGDITNGNLENGLVTGEIPTGIPSQNINDTQENTMRYIVKPGDTLWKIANSQSTNVTTIKQLNNLTEDSLSVGMELLIPAKGGQTVAPPTPSPNITPVPPTTETDNHAKYIVQPGDTLWHISNRFGISVDAIMKANNLSNEYLSTGQSLIISEYVPDMANLDKALLEKIKYFPISDGYSYYYTNDYQAPRTWSASGETERSHQGNDIMAKTGTPLIAVADGKIARYGWNSAGGYRLMLKVDGTDKAIYYAHMSQYAPDIKLGSTVKAGQVIGYVGSTGYGVEGTSGMFDPHLHIGFYNTADYSTTTNPFDYLRSVEGSKV